MAQIAFEHTPLIDDAEQGSDAGDEVKQTLSSRQMVGMTVLLAGIQFVWTVELGYGTPYLLSLGLSKPLMTLVWMAGPLSGLIIQPVVGGLSDKCMSRMGRRRPYIIGGAAFVVMSMVAIAYARELALALAQVIYGSGTDPTSDFVTRTAIMLAVVGFYVLDFSINTSQACARALALDIPPLSQQDLANAYAGRMLNLGSVSGYLLGFMDLRTLVPWHAASQMQALCVLAIIVFVTTITWTCISVREEPLKHRDTSANEQHAGDKTNMLWRIVRGVRQLPSPVQRVCNVQLFAWIAWFPFLFFATSWVGEVMARTEDPLDPEFADRATRAGSFALFLYSVASLMCSVALPVFVNDNDEQRVPWTIGLRAMWRLSLVAMGVVLLGTYFVLDVRMATLAIVAMAFPWALAMWAPFALVGEFVAIMAQAKAESEEIDEEEDDEYIVRSLPTKPAADQMRLPANRFARLLEARRGSSATTVAGDSDSGLWRYPSQQSQQPRVDSIASTILDDPSAAALRPPRNSLGMPTSSATGQNGTRSVRTATSTEESVSADDGERLAAGTILGIHNMYVVLPQFLINGISSLIFAWFGNSGGEAEHGLRSVEFLAMQVVAGKTGHEVIGWVLRIGGVSALVAAGFTVFLYDRHQVRRYVHDMGGW